MPMNVVKVGNSVTDNGEYWPLSAMLFWCILLTRVITQNVNIVNSNDMAIVSNSSDVPTWRMLAVW